MKLKRLLMISANNHKINFDTYTISDLYKLYKKDLRKSPKDDKKEEIKGMMNKINKNKLVSFVMNLFGSNNKKEITNMTKSDLKDVIIEKIMVK